MIWFSEPVYLLNYPFNNVMHSHTLRVKIVPRNSHARNISRDWIGSRIFIGGGGGGQAHYERGTELTFGRGPGPA